MRSVRRLTVWAKGVLVALVVLYVWWVAHPRIAGIPDWLGGLGLLHWLEKLHPLEVWLFPLSALAVAFVALFQDRLRMALFRARLDLYVRPGVSISWGTIPAHHFRLAVESRSVIAAQFVEIVVNDIWVDGKRASWWSPMALGWTDGNESNRELLSGNTTRLCDFLMLVKPGNAAEEAVAPSGFKRPKPPGFDFDSRACLKLMTSVPYPNDTSNVLLPGSYTLGLELAAENYPPRSYFFAVEFDGGWSSDPEAGIVSIRELQGSSAPVVQRLARG
jgi:hypothetical protein